MKIPSEWRLERGSESSSAPPPRFPLQGKGSGRGWRGGRHRFNSCGEQVRPTPRGSLQGRHGSHCPPRRLPLPVSSCREVCDGNPLFRPPHRGFPGLNPYRREPGWGPGQVHARFTPNLSPNAALWDLNIRAFALNCPNCSSDPSHPPLHVRRKWPKRPKCHVGCCLGVYIDPAIPSQTWALLPFHTLSWKTWW